MCVFVIVSGCLCIGDPTARLVKRLGAVDTNKGVLIVWSRVTVLRSHCAQTGRPRLASLIIIDRGVNGLATVLIFNKQQSDLNLVSNLLLFLCTFVDFHYGILITKVSFKIGYKLLNTLLVL